MYRLLFDNIDDDITILTKFKQIKDKSKICNLVLWNDELYLKESLEDYDLKLYYIYLNKCIDQLKFKEMYNKNINTDKTFKGVIAKNDIINKCKYEF